MERWSGVGVEGGKVYPSPAGKSDENFLFGIRNLRDAFYEYS